MFFLTLIAAQAEPVCEPLALASSFPASAATDVPLSVAPYLTFSGFCGDASYTVTIADDATEVFSETFDPAALPSPTGTLVWDGPVVTLEGATSYTLTVTGDLDTWSVPFTTGEQEAAVVPPDAVQLTLSGAVGYTTDEIHYVDVSVDVDMPGSLPVVVNYSGRELLLFDTADRRDDITVVAPGGEICMTPLGRDAVGTWVEGAEACVDVDEEEPPVTSCSSAPSWHTSLGWLLRRR